MEDPPSVLEENLHVHFAFELRKDSTTRVQVRLLGPCFKTGRLEQRQRMSHIQGVRRREPGNADTKPREKLRCGKTLHHATPSRARSACTRGADVSDSISTAAGVFTASPQRVADAKTPESVQHCSSPRVARENPNLLRQRSERRLEATLAIRAAAETRSPRTPNFSAATRQTATPASTQKPRPDSKRLPPDGFTHS